MSNLTSRFAAVLFGIVIGALSFEIGLRIMPRSLSKEFKIIDRIYTARQTWENMMEGDPYLGYKLKPQVDVPFQSEGRTIRYQTQSYGLGDIGFRDIGTHAPFDAVVVGDSFSLCDDAPAEACWVRHLNDSTGLSFATLGVNGYSTLAAERVLDRYGVKLKPKLVLASMYPNDFKDNENFDAWTRSGTDNFWVWLGNRRGRGPWSRWLTNHSMLFRVVDAYTRSHSRPIHRFKQDELDFVFRFDVWWVRAARNMDNHPGFKLMKESFERMRQVSKDNDAKFVVLLFPTKEQIYWNYAKQFSPDASLDANRPLDAVRKYCEDAGITYCDLQEAFRSEAAKGRQLYHPISQHWNDAGNDVAARAIEKCLSAKGIVPPVRVAHLDTPAVATP